MLTYVILLRAIIACFLPFCSISFRPLAELVNVRQRIFLEVRMEVQVSHRPTRRREKIMGRFKSPRQAQRFLSVHDQIQIIFRPRCHALSAAAYRQTRADATGFGATSRVS
jgi:putative transposase|tara:strand:+ start:116 stop:448 length:333 start_codon:yes stop_codon:yes gene_type:complete